MPPPEREESSYDEPESYAYGDAAPQPSQPGPIADLLTDPLPAPPVDRPSGRRRRPPEAPAAPAAAGDDAPSGRHSSVWFRDEPPAATPPQGGGRHAAPAPTPPQEPQEPLGAPYVPPADDETIGLRTADTRRIAALNGTGPDDGTAAYAAAQDTHYESDYDTEYGDDADSAGHAEDSAEADGAEQQAAPVTGGRAERRRAARKGGRRRAAQGTAQEAAEEEGGPAKPLSRVEARRAARAAKPGAGVLVSRGIGEVFITMGVLMLLFVTYQLWWSNIRAHREANGAAHSLQDDWAKGKGRPGAFEPGQGFAIMHIPKLDVVVPIAEGIDKHTVLDRGMVGHYGKDSINTPMPDAKSGNFGVAGHRNTHGEPFRYINRLKPGDPIIVETRDDYYVYRMTSILPSTPPSNTSVLEPVPPQSGFTKPGRYITLTTCTPEFTSKYRMIVWGKMVEDRPRSEGKPKELVG